MKNHPIIKYLYILLAVVFTALSGSFFLVKDMEVYTLNFQIIALITALIIMLLSVFGYSQAKIKGLFICVYSLAVIFLAPIPMMLYHYFHCQGKWCNLADYFICIALVGLSVTTIVLHYVGKLLAKRNYLNKLFKFLYTLIAIMMVIEIVLYIAITFFGYYPFSSGEAWFNIFSSFYYDVSMAVIPVIVFAIYPLKIAEAEYENTNLK